MESKTAKLVNPQRVLALLECYGGNAENWPEEERVAAKALIKSSAELQQRQREAQQLDELMGIAEVKASLTDRADPATVANIVNALPEPPTGNTVDLLDYRRQKAGDHPPKRPNTWWTYGAVAAVLFLAVGIILQLSPQSPPSPAMRTAAVTQQELDQWMWQETTGSDETSAELAEENTELPITYLAMVELDLLPEDE